LLQWAFQLPGIDIEQDRADPSSIPRQCARFKHDPGFGEILFRQTKYPGATRIQLFGDLIAPARAFFDIRREERRGALQYRLQPIVQRLAEFATEFPGPTDEDVHVHSNGIFVFLAINVTRRMPRTFAATQLGLGPQFW
jgi:hypothetical protein